jgi:hypothetical protein
MLPGGLRAREKCPEFNVSAGWPACQLCALDLACPPHCASHRVLDGVADGIFVEQ